MPKTKLLYITNQICGSGGLERVLSIKASFKQLVCNGSVHIFPTQLVCNGSVYILLSGFILLLYQGSEKGININFSILIPNSKTSIQNYPSNKYHLPFH